MNLNRAFAAVILLCFSVCLFGSEAEEIRKRLPSLKGEQKLTALGELYDLSLQNDEFQVQLACINEYFAEAHLQGNKRSEGEARKLRIILFYNNFLNDSVLHHAPDDLRFLRDSQDWSYYYCVWSCLVNVYVYNGSVALGMQEAEKMYADARERSDEEGLALAYSVMGHAYYNMHNMQEASDAYRKSIDLLMKIHPLYMELPNLFSSYCDVLEEMRDYRQLQSLTEQWKDCLAQMISDWKLPEDHPGLTPLQAYRLIACAQAAIGLDDMSTAAKMLEDARGLIPSDEEDVYRTWLFYKIRFCQRENRQQDALTYSDKLSDLTARIDDVSEQVRVKQQRAEILMLLNRTAEAAELYKEMYMINDSVNRHDSKRKLAEMNTIFHVDELKVKQAEEQARQQMLSIIIIASIIVLALVIFIYFRQRSAKRLKVAHEKLEETHSQLLTAYDQLEETTAAKERIESDLRIARNIQMSMVPSTFPDREDLDLFASMTPAKEVGGDLYGFHLIGDLLYFCLGDVSGKGVPASLFMAQATRLFRTLAAQRLAPASIATQINEALSGEDNTTCMFVTMFIGLIDLTTGHLDFCNAGHNPPVLIGDGEAEFIEMIPNAPIGMWPGLKYQGEEIADISNRPLFVYTDGLNEAENRQQEQFTDERLLEILKTTPFESAMQTVELLKGEVEKHRDGAEPNDDLTMLCLKVIKEKTKTIEL